MPPAPRRPLQEVEGCDRSDSVSSSDEEVDSVSAGNDGVAFADDRFIATVFFGLCGVCGLASPVSPFGAGGMWFRVYGNLVQCAMTALLIGFPVVNWFTGGFGAWLRAGHVDQTVLGLQKNLDMMKVIVTAAAVFFTLVMVNADFRAGDDGTSVVDKVWTTKVPQDWWRRHRLKPLIALAAFVPVEIMTNLQVANLFQRALYSIMIAYMGILTFYLFVSTIVLLSEIDQAGKASEQSIDSGSQLPKIFRRMQAIQETWLDNGGLVYNTELGLGASISSACMVVAVDIFLIGSLREQGATLATATGEVKTLSKLCIVQLTGSAVFISFALSPALIITSACDEMFKKVNALAGRLIQQAAELSEGEHEAIAKLERDLILCGHFKDFYRDLNNKQGMGFVVVGVRISVPFVKAVAVALISVIAVYLPQTYHFYSS